MTKVFSSAFLNCILKSAVPLPFSTEKQTLPEKCTDTSACPSFRASVCLVP